MQRPRIVKELQNMGYGTQFLAGIATTTGFVTRQHVLSYAFASVFLMLFSSVFFALDYCCQALESVTTPNEPE